MSEMVIIEPAVLNLQASRYYDFAVPLEGFDFVIDDYDYYAEIRDTQGIKKASFTIITGADQLILIIRREVLDTLESNTFYYDLKRVSKDATKWESPILGGTFTVTSGRTKQPYENND